MRQTFAEHIHQLRNGDPSAVDAFIEAYGPYLRRSLRFRIRRAGLQAAADSVDVFQSAMADFLFRLAAGQFEFTSESDLRQLLVTIAHRKFVKLNRKEWSAKRDRRVTSALNEKSFIPSSTAGEPGLSLMLCEYQGQLNAQLSPAELELVRLRREGLPWAEIAKLLGQDADVLRQRYSRALRRIIVYMESTSHDR